MTQEGRNALPPGTELDGYRIEAVLGVGDFGITYRATHVPLDRQVVIKEYLPINLAVRETDGLGVAPIGAEEGEDFGWGLERLRTEARTLIGLRHPNTVGVYAYMEARGTGYLVTDYVRGQAIARRLEVSETLDEGAIQKILDPLLDGLAAIHRNGLLHGDIKPANIFIRADGSPVLIDFGVARQALARHSKSLISIVAPRYAPIEQFVSDGQQGPWTDIYSLGGVLYRCVTGLRPCEAPSRVSALVRGEDDPMPPAREAAKGGYSGRLLAGIDHALAVEPADRPQSVGDWRDVFGIRTVPH